MRNKFKIDGDEVIIQLGGKRNLSTRISLSSFERVVKHIPCTWGHTPNSHGKSYVKARIKGRTVSLHRVITDAPEGKVVDHIDGDGLNNTDGNLRIGSHQQNMCNRRGKAVSNTGVRGVSLDGRGKYRARVGQVQIGSFSTLEEATMAVEKARKEMYGEWA